MRLRAIEAAGLKVDVQFEQYAGDGNASSWIGSAPLDGIVLLTMAAITLSISGYRGGSG
jgi:hypothetical protein